MCVEYSMKCKCGGKEASFNLYDGIMPPDVVSRLYCPSCSKDVSFNPETMVSDNGWIIEYDMEVASFMSVKLPESANRNLSPETLFDRGYATWRGVYPGDHIDSVREKTDIIKLAKVDPRAYFEKMRTWANARMERLKKEGWRKAVNETV